VFRGGARPRRFPDSWDLGREEYAESKEEPSMGEGDPRMWMKEGGGKEKKEERKGLEG